MEECSNNMERLLAISLSHNGATPVTLASNTYDALGRLATSSVNNGGISTAYAYNVRGWVQSVTNAHFYEWIHYQDAPSGGTPCWGGDISGITWLQRESLKAATSVESQYKFSYDGLNRLTKADFSSSGEQWNGDLISQGDRDFSCSYAYDLNGNMKSLRRYGVSLYNTFLPTHIRNYGIIDDLTMAYDGNRLKSVSDAAKEPTYAGAMDFRDGADGAVEYTYDANGNMTSDLNKGISSITYNMLNLPQTVLFDDGHETCYTYAADGRKLRVEYRLNNFSIVEAEKAKASDGYDAIASPSALDENGIIETPAEPISRTLMTRDYCGNYIYKNGCLERVMTENGYMQDGGLYFYIKDYQGNVRVVLNQANQPVEVNSYYPYGGLMAATTTEGIQPYKYGTKELDRENGLDLYDSKARMYDPTIGRTPTQDPMAEKYYSMSPYLWCAANPITFTDPTGMAVFWHNGKVIGDDGIDDQKIYVIKTTEKKFTSQNTEVAGAGLSKKRQKATIGFIKANSGNSDAFSKNSIAYDNSIEIEGNVANRQKMVDIVSSDNGSGGTSDANNREYGGYIEDGEVKAVDSGPVCYPSEYTQATINLPCGKSTFHSHPSGTFKRVLLIGTISRTVDEPAYIQPTSSLDIQNAGHHVHYVFGRGNGMVYIYNSSAIQAVIPFNRFVKPKLK